MKEKKSDNVLCSKCGSKTRKLDDHLKNGSSNIYFYICTRSRCKHSTLIIKNTNEVNNEK